MEERKKGQWEIRLLATRGFHPFLLLKIKLVKAKF